MFIADTGILGQIVNVLQTLGILQVIQVGAVAMVAIFIYKIFLTR